MPAAIQDRLTAQAPNRLSALPRIRDPPDASPRHSRALIRRRPPHTPATATHGLTPHRRPPSVPPRRPGPRAAPRAAPGPAGRPDPHRIPRPPNPDGVLLDGPAVPPRRKAR